MDNYSTKHKVILGMAVVLLLAVGSALGYLVGSARSDARSGGPFDGAVMNSTPQGGTLGPGRAASDARVSLTRDSPAGKQGD